MFWEILIQFLIRINLVSQSGNPLAEVKQYDVGLFVTDDWRVRPDLTLSFGLRYENQTNISDNMNFRAAL